MKAPKYSTAIKDYMAAHVPRYFYMDNVRAFCVSCEEPIVADIERYEQRGNYCQKCESQCEQMSREKRMTENQLNQVFRARFPDENVDRIVEKLKLVL